MLFFPLSVVVGKGVFRMYEMIYFVVSEQVFLWLSYSKAAFCSTQNINGLWKDKISLILAKKMPLRNASEHCH